MRKSPISIDSPPPADLERPASTALPAARGRKASDAESLSLLILIIVFVLVSILWALTIPIPAARADAAAWDGFNPDEQVHMRYIVYLAAHFRLPVPWVGSEASGKDIYTAVHPPLYYAFGAIIYAIAAPFLGYGNTLLLLRIVSCAIGAGVVYFTYRTARRLLPHDISLLAAGFVAGVPMFVSLSGAVANDAAAALFASGALMTMADGLTEGFDRRRALQLALWVTAGIAVKTTDLALFPAAALAILLAPGSEGKGRQSDGRARLTHLLTIMLVPSVGIGWWFARNQYIYGDPLQARMHHTYWIQTEQHPWWTMMTVPQFFWNGSFGGWQSFWGTFDAFSRPMPDIAYYAILSLQIPAAIGFLIFVARGGLREKAVRNTAFTLALFAALVLVIFYAVNWRIFSPQGRYLFPLLPVFGIASAVGGTAVWKPRWRVIPLFTALAMLLLLNLFALIIMPLRPAGH